MFGKIEQTDKSVNREGIGLGLYITRNLAVALGGIIEMKSEEGRFTHFMVTLPVLPVKKVRKGGSNTEEDQSGEESAKKKLVKPGEGQASGDDGNDSEFEIDKETVIQAIVTKKGGGNLLIEP